MIVKIVNTECEDYNKEFKLRRMNYDQVVVNYPDSKGIRVFNKDSVEFITETEIDEFLVKYNDFLKINSSVLNIEICNPIFYKNDKTNYILLKLTDENKKMISNISFANVNNNYICSIDYNYNDEKHIILCNLTLTI